MVYKVLHNLSFVHLSNFIVSLDHTSFPSLQLPTSLPIHCLCAWVSSILELSFPEFLTRLPPLHHVGFSSSVISLERSPWNILDKALCYLPAPQSPSVQSLCWLSFIERSIIWIYLLYLFVCMLLSVHPTQMLAPVKAGFVSVFFITLSSILGRVNTFDRTNTAMAVVSVFPQIMEARLC